MPAIKRGNQRGDTLVEVLIAMVLTLFIFMAVLASALLATDTNTRNMLRNEAARIAAQSMSWARSCAFANMAKPPTQGGPLGSFQTTSNFRNFQEPYSVTNGVTQLDHPNNHDLITVTVQWSWRGQQQTPYTVQSVIGNSAQ